LKLTFWTNTVLNVKKCIYWCLSIIEHTSMFQAGFKPRIPNKRAALDRAATRIGYWWSYTEEN